MHGVWRVGSFPDEVWLARAFGGSIPASATLISPTKAAWRVNEWFLEGGHARQMLAEILEDVGAPKLMHPALGLEALRSQVRAALRAGSLRAFRIAVKLSGAPLNVEPSRPKDVEPPLEKKTWIGIELMDDGNPPKPVPFKKYRIELPDQSIREGMLDGNGQARLEGFDPGACKVSFPQLHGPDWDKT